MNTLKIYTIGVCVLLTGCASVKPPIAPTQPAAASVGGTTLGTTTPGQVKAATWDQHLSEVKQINSWALNGSVSITHSGKTDIASLQWQQQQMNNYNIMLSGPLSIGHVGISSHGGAVTLAQSGKQTVTANSAEQLMQQQLGWQLPVSSMYYWVRGIPAPGGKPNMSLDSQNHLTQLAQQGWVITYDGYQQVQNVDLPNTVTMSNPRLQVRLVIKRWTL